MRSGKTLIRLREGAQSYLESPLFVQTGGSVFVPRSICPITYRCYFHLPISYKVNESVKTSARLLKPPPLLFCKGGISSTSEV